VIHRTRHDYGMRRMPTDIRDSALTMALTLGLALSLGGCIEGPAGPAGADGADGASGPACWDLNANGTTEPDTEDLNGDGAVNVLDCIGPDGDDGDDGDDGEDWSVPGRVGAEVCAVCHEDHFDAWLRSGHAWALVAIDGEPEAEPWDDLGNFGDYPSNPPTPNTWGDISYVLGGWAWKQVFIDTDGFIVTGEAARYNIDDGSWGEYMPEAPAGTAPSFDCVSCHTSGFRSVEPPDGLDGLPATWRAAGIDCEECHGGGAHHAETPHDAPMRIDRDAEFCGGCHTRGPEQVVPGADGFIEHASQYNQFASSKHRALDCVDCHDPHRSAVYDDNDFNPDQGIVPACESCHYSQAANANTAFMGALDCEYCHMPPATKAALGDLDAFTGDQAAHLWAINSDIEAPQFDDDGNAMPYLTLDYACRWCHVPGGGSPFFAGDKTDEELAESAFGYHEPSAD
jgi:hypothetical protein